LALHCARQLSRVLTVDAIGIAHPRMQFAFLCCPCFLFSFSRKKVSN
jgi:hypothetical protein